MKLDQLIDGLVTLLKDNNYSLKTIEFYQREWAKLRSFLLDEFNSTDFSLQKGLKYLENQYGIISKYDTLELSQREVQLLRVIHLLEDYMLHGVITRRFTASKNPIKLDSRYQTILDQFVFYLNQTDLSHATKEHYTKITRVFLDYLMQCRISSLSSINLKICHNFIKTFSGYSFKTVEQKICGLRYFLRYLCRLDMISSDLASKIHIPNMPKGPLIPSTWSKEELS